MSTPSVRAILKNEQEKSPLSRGFTAGLNKEKVLAKGSIKYVFGCSRSLMGSYLSGLLTFLMFYLIPYFHVFLS